MRKVLRRGAVVGAIVGTTALGASVSWAVLPGAADEQAGTTLEGRQVEVPGPADAAGTHPQQRGASAEATADAATDEAADEAAEDAADEAETGSEGAGSEISRLATTTDATGVDKGAEISTAASGGKSRAGQAGAPSDAPAAKTGR